MKANDHGPQRSSLISANQAPAIPFGRAGGARPTTTWPSVARGPGAASRAYLSKAARLLGIGAACALISLSVPAAVAAGAPLPGVPVSWHGPGHGVPPLLPPSSWTSLPGPGPGSLGTATVGSAPVGAGPSVLAIDPATHTLYVANGHNDNGPRSAGGDTLSVIDTRHCRAEDVSRCHGPWPTITVGNLPGAIAVDQASDTVYVANVGDDTVSVFNGATCNAKETSGCSQHPATVPVGLGPQWVLVDPVNHTVYVANFDDGGPSTTVSMINSETCNGSDLAACPSTEPPTVDVGGSPDYIDVNQATRTAYVTTIGALNGWTVFNADTCNAVVQSGCTSLGYLAGDSAGPNAGQVDPANDTLYTANYDNTVSAFDLSHCNAGDLAGCSTAPVGTVSLFPHLEPNALYVAVDVALHSVYVTYQQDDEAAVVDTDVCNGSSVAACAALDPPLAGTGGDPEGVVLDPQTQTLYTANEVDNDVSVIAASRCNAEVTRGCYQDPPGAPVGALGSGSTVKGLAADPAVSTLYATTANNAVAMVDTQSCNSHVREGCPTTPPEVSVGPPGRDSARPANAHCLRGERLPARPGQCVGGQCRHL